MRRDVAVVWALAEVSPADFLFEKLIYHEIYATSKVKDENHPFLGAAISLLRMFHCEGWLFGCW